MGRILSGQSNRLFFSGSVFQSPVRARLPLRGRYLRFHNTGNFYSILRATGSCIIHDIATDARDRNSKSAGFSVSGIIMLLSKGFMQPVLIAIVIACPLGWIVMEQWLQSFPYRTTISTWPFAVSGILVLLIAFMSVSSQAMRAAMSKPSETLKHE